jgi:uncharacterized protein YbbK (DUF523 family)
LLKSILEILTLAYNARVFYLEKILDKQKLLISSCFLGNLVKYNGSHNALDDYILNKLKEKYDLFPVCPEVDGGLPTPRVPCEIVSNNPIKVVNKDGSDKTTEFFKGANIALELCKKYNITLALMKANSPSCSNDKINDGSFTKTRIEGLGVAAKLLIGNGVVIYNEEEVEKLIY